MCAMINYSTLENIYIYEPVLLPVSGKSYQRQSDNTIPLNGPGLPVERPSDGAQEIPGREETVAGQAVGETNAGRPTLSGPTEGRPNGATTRGETKRLNLREDVETHQRESLRTPVPTVWAGIHMAS